MTPEQRLGATQAVTDAWKPLQTGDVTADAKSLLDTIAKTPGFADAGLGGDGSVWARYADGRPTMWILSDDDQSKPTPAPTQQASLAAPPAPQIAPLPTRPDAALFEFDSPLNGDVVSEVARMLKTAEYEPRIVADRVSELQTQIKNLGVLAAYTHGGVGVTSSGHPQYALVTDDLWQNRAEDAANLALYRKGLLVPTQLRLRPGTYWAVNTDFVRNFWTFTENALIYIGACGLYATPAGKVFAESLRSASEGGSATILGWDGGTLIPYDSLTSKRFFARVLGDNSVDHEKIPRRPFTYKQVFDWMAKNGEIQPLPFAPKLTITYGPSEDGELVPSVMKVNVLHPGPKSQVPHPGEWQVEIIGSFGPDPGPENRSVTISQTPLEVYPNDWSPGVIRAKLPASMSGGPSYGDLTVEVRDHLSNVVPITQWTGTVIHKQTLLNTEDQGIVTFTCPVRVTADVHPFRVDASAEPRITFAAPMEATGDCTYRMSGSWRSGNDTTCTLSGGGSFTVPAGALTQVVSMSQKWDPNATNHGEAPPRMFVFPPQNDPGQAPGTITCRSSSGTHTTTHDGLVFTGGSYWMNKPVGLQANTFNVLKQTLNCNYGDAYANCSEVWELTAHGPIPTKDTPA